MARWDDLELLRVIDELEGAEPASLNGGWALLQRMMQTRGGAPPSAPEIREFTRELSLGSVAGYVEYHVYRAPGGVAEPDRERDPADWLQRTNDIRLTLAGRDRARGRVIHIDHPNAEEDDLRAIRRSTLEIIARLIGEEYTGVRLPGFLQESGIPASLAGEFEGTKWVYVLNVFDSLHEGGSAARRTLRTFLGAWLDGRFASGPSQEASQRILDDFARQGWFVRDGRLIASEPVAGRRQASPLLVLNRLGSLHPSIVEVSGKLFEDGHRAAAILEAFKALNQRVRELSGLQGLDGEKLMGHAFRNQDPPLQMGDLVTETGRNMQEGLRFMFMGVMRAFRNPQAHERFVELDQAEALDQLVVASLLMRYLDAATPPVPPSTIDYVEREADNEVT